VTDREDAPGWDAIDAAIAPLVGSRTPHHWGTGTLLPGQDGLWGISAYDLGSYWFFVTYGLSELFTKDRDDPLVSGWGEELTLRVRRDRESPPDWVPPLLARLGQLVFQRATPFLPAGRLALLDASDGAPPALAWAADPQLDPITTPFGAVQFVATVGISEAMLERMRATSTADVLASVGARNPLFVIGDEGLMW
jgi:Suppressor of fused protein (SUFU)